MNKNNIKPHCFWCKHLILDGCDSWCEIRRAGTPCEDYIFNKDRYETVKKNERRYELNEES